MDKKELKRIMDSPNRKYALYPIVHERICDTALAERNYKLGFGGAVGNIKYEHGFQDSEKCWKTAENGFRKYKELGMYTWIYDEDGYPSGSAGGYLAEDYPQFTATGLYCYIFPRILKGPMAYRSSIPDGVLHCAVLLSADGKNTVDITGKLNENNVLYFDLPEGEWKLNIFMKRHLYDGSHNSLSYASPRDYINLTDGDAVDKFIEYTHENYKKYLSDEFGKSIVATFTDEPSLVSAFTGGGICPLLTWQEDFPQKFLERFGYNINDATLAVLNDRKANRTKLRCDYWDFIADAVTTNYFKKIQDWCHRNNLKSSGHLLSEESLSSHILYYGSFLRSLRYFDWPGADRLDIQPERLTDTEKIPSARLVASFADINGENEAFTEVSDHAFASNNLTAPKEWYYNSVNQLAAMGINNFTSYFSFRGFSDEEIIKFNEYTSRINEIMHRGVRACDTAVLYPECDAWAAMTVKAEHAWFAGGENMRIIHENFAKTSWELLFGLVDFDYIDNKILQEAAIKDEELRIIERHYKNIVLPSFYVAENESAKKIIELAESGITIYLISDGCILSRETGEESPFKNKFAELVSRGKIISENSPEKLAKKFRGGMVKSELSAKTLLSHFRLCDDGTGIIFLTNTSETPVSDKLTVTEKYSEIYRFDALNGTVETIIPAHSDPNTSFDINLGAYRALIYILKK